MSRRKRRRHTPEPYPRRGRARRFFRTLGRVLFTCVLMAAAVAALAVFFKVKTISVEGAMKYGSEELISGMDIQKGDNLYLWNKNRVIADLMRDFPYLETVQLRRRLPDALVLTVTECSAAAAVKNEDGTFTYISAAGKLLENSTSDSALPIVIGVTLDGEQPGDFIRQAADVHTDALLEILQTVDAAEMLDKLSFINVQDLTDIRIGCDKRFDIRVGTLDDLAYRLRFAQTVIDERLSPSDIGRLYWDTQERMHFVPDTAENVAKSGTEQASSAPVTSPAYTNPDGETGQTADAANPDGSTDNPDGTDGTDTSDSTDSSDTSDGEYSYDESGSDEEYSDGSYDDSGDSDYYDDSDYSDEG